VPMSVKEESVEAPTASSSGEDIDGGAFALKLQVQAIFFSSFSIFTTSVLVDVVLQCLRGVKSS